MTSQGLLVGIVIGLAIAWAYFRFVAQKT